MAASAGIGLPREICSVALPHAERVGRRNRGRRHRSRLWHEGPVAGGEQSTRGEGDLEGLEEFAGALEAFLRGLCQRPIDEGLQILREAPVAPISQRRESVSQ